MFKLYSFLLLSGISIHVSGLNTVPEFTAVFDSKKRSVEIKWEHSAAGIKTYTIQCSADNKTWKDIAVQGIKPDQGSRIFYFEDKKPGEGENYYRLTSSSDLHEIEYSRSVMVIIPVPGKGWIMYPVPVKDFLTLEYRGAEPLKGVINVFVQQSSGRIIYRLRSSSLNRSITIPVHNLGKGIYDVRIIIEDELVWNQRFVK